MTYEQFIKELRELIIAGEGFRGYASAGTREFRDWRYRAEMVVRGIQAQGYIVPGAFGSAGRVYRPTWAPAKAEVIRAVFDRELGDSLTELRFIVEDFEKYGAPRSPGGQQAAVAALPPATSGPLSAPEKVTVRWMIDHVPVPLWLTAVGIVAAAFLAGFAVGQIPAVRAVVCSVKPDACPQPAPQAQR
jgi:hypothetical protein